MSRPVTFDFSLPLNRLMPVRSSELVRRRRKPCALCGGMAVESPPWDKKEWACRPCWNGYVNFRRAFKLEHGRYPTFEEVMAEGDEPPNDKLSDRRE